LQLRCRREYLGERVSVDPPHFTVPNGPYAGRARGAGDHAQVPDRVAAPHLAKNLPVGTDNREPPRGNDVDGVRWVSKPKEPLIGGDVAAIDGAGELIELFVVDVSE
jgi:hypothetical protein